ncbi:MAG: hypothetical protein CK542_00350 [Acidimicrobium sp.]|nr:MAG: hypothetical protein CK542_00350 [Acidimicrobium sp.]
MQALSTISNFLRHPIRKSNQAQKIAKNYLTRQKFLPIQRVVEHGSKFGKSAKQHRQSYILYGFYSIGSFASLVTNSKKPCG